MADFPDHCSRMTWACSMIAHLIVRRLVFIWCVLHANYGQGRRKTGQPNPWLHEPWPAATHNSATSHAIITCDIPFDAPCNCASFGACGIFFPCKLRKRRVENCAGYPLEPWMHRFHPFPGHHSATTHPKIMHGIPFDSPCDSTSENMRLVIYGCDLRMQWPRKCSP